MLGKCELKCPDKSNHSVDTKWICRLVLRWNAGQLCCVMVCSLLCFCKTKKTYTFVHFIIHGPHWCYQKGWCVNLAIDLCIDWPYHWSTQSRPIVDLPFCLFLLEGEGSTLSRRTTPNAKHENLRLRNLSQSLSQSRLLAKRSVLPLKLSFCERRCGRLCMFR